MNLCQPGREAVFKQTMRLTRAHPGGAKVISAPPSFGFLQITQKTAARSAAALGIAVHSSFPEVKHHCLKILAPGHVRSGLQVTLSDVTSKRNLATLTPCHSHSYEPSVFKLLEVDEVNSSSNLYILDFLYSWPEVRSISVTCRAMLSQWAKFQLPLRCSHQNISIHWEWCWLRSSVMTQATVFIGDPPKVIWGHLRSTTVFFANNFWSKRARDVRVVSLCFSHQDASIHM